VISAPLEHSPFTKTVRLLKAVLCSLRGGYPSTGSSYFLKVSNFDQTRICLVWYMSIQTPHDWASMAIRMTRVHHASVLGLLLLVAIALQGCLAMVWLGAVGVDMSRTSEIEFQPFENTLVVELQEGQQLGLVKSIAVMPFVGDPAMAERWTVVLREMTDLRIVSSSDAVQVDCVLNGKVAGEEPTKTFVGLKESTSRRLYLHLVTDSGILMWKTEMPYTIEQGAKNLDEEAVTKALLTHVRTHADAIGLTELGVRSQRIVSRSLRG